MKALFKWNSAKRPRWVVIKIRTARILVKNEKEKKRHPYLQPPGWTSRGLPWVRKSTSWKVVYHMIPLICYCCSVTKSCPAICNPMDCSTPGFPVLHYLLELAQIRVHWIGEAIQPSHPLSPPSSSTLNLPQHQGLFKWVGTLHQMAKVSDLQHQHQYFQSIYRVDIL